MENKITNKLLSTEVKETIIEDLIFFQSMLTDAMEWPLISVRITRAKQGH